VTSIGPRLVAAAAALKPLGLTLIVSPDEFIITDKPDDLGGETSIHYESIDQVDAFIADNRRTGATQQVAAGNAYIATTYGDPPLTVSSGTVTASAGYSHGGTVKAIEARRPRVCDSVHYVSYGTPGGEYGSECRAAIVTEVTQVEVNEQSPAGDGIYRQAVGLMVANPTGQFFNRGLLYAEGETLAAGPTNLCGGLYFPGGTWHWCSA
jgi:hypothetical protein